MQQVNSRSLTLVLCLSLSLSLFRPTAAVKSGWLHERNRAGAGNEQQTGSLAHHKGITGDQAVDDLLSRVQVTHPHSKKIVLACAIFTYHGNHEKLVGTYNSWGKQCDHFFAYSDEEFVVEQASMTKAIKIHSGRGELFSTSLMIHKDLADKIDSGRYDFDFVTVSGDDALFVMPNLRSYLAGLPPLTSSNSFKTKNASPNYGFEMIGGIDAYRRYAQDPWVGGAGYVLNRKVITSRLLSRCPSSGANEDMAVSACLFGQGVVPRNTVDGEGHPRFCRESIGKSCDYLSKNQTDMTISRDAILWHYIGGSLRDAASRYLNGS